jgi:membrane-associated phospholipid phosphatase
LPVLHHSVNLPTNDWIGLGRLMGFAPTWIVVGVALLLVDRAEAIVGEPSYLKYRRLTLLLSSAALGGLAAEALKIVARRERPAADATEHVFRSITDRPFYGGGLGLPSGHAATAAAALYCMWRFFPSAAPVWITLMIGCGLSRLADGSHFVSDVYCGAIVGVVTASLIWVNDDRKRGRRTSDPSLLHIAA